MKIWMASLIVFVLTLIAMGFAFRKDKEDE
jgi:hypothetical protein